MALWTKGPAPAEYFDVQICREFGCLPSQLYDEDAAHVEMIMAALEAESIVNETRSRQKAGK